MNFIAKNSVRVAGQLALMLICGVVLADDEVGEAEAVGARDAFLAMEDDFPATYAVETRFEFDGRYDEKPVLIEGTQIFVVGKVFYGEKENQVWRAYNQGNRNGLAFRNDIYCNGTSIWTLSKPLPLGRQRVWSKVAANWSDAVGFEFFQPRLVSMSDPSLHTVWGLKNDIGSDFITEVKFSKENLPRQLKIYLKVNDDVNAGKQPQSSETLSVEGNATLEWQPYREDGYLIQKIAFHYIEPTVETKLTMQFRWILGKAVSPRYLANPEDFVIPDLEDLKFEDKPRYIAENE